jgi:CarboxypepD_reg-like domain
MPYPSFFLRIFCCLALWGLLAPTQVSAQGQAEPIYLSGVMIDGKTSEPIPAAHLYIPKAGHGTAASADGYFILPTMPGDSLIIDCIGYKKRYYIVPRDKGESYSVVIEMNQDLTTLPIVEVFAYPTEEMFKEAFLALELPDEDKIERIQETVERNYMMRMAFDAPMDAGANHRYQMDRDFTRASTRGTIPTLQLLNPFAWAQFIKSVKRGDYKRGKWKDKK